MRSATEQAIVLIAMRPLFNVSRKAHSMTQKNEQAGSSFIIRIFSLCLGSRSRLFLLAQYSFFLTSRRAQFGCGERSSLPRPPLVPDGQSHGKTWSIPIFHFLGQSDWV